MFTVMLTNAWRSANKLCGHGDSLNERPWQREINESNVQPREAERPFSGRNRNSVTSQWPTVQNRTLSQIGIKINWYWRTCVGTTHVQLLGMQKPEMSTLDKTSKFKQSTLCNAKVASNDVWGFCLNPIGATNVHQARAHR